VEEGGDTASRGDYHCVRNRPAGRGRHQFVQLYRQCHRRRGLRHAPRLPTHLEAAVAAFPIACGTAPALSTIAAPQSVVTLLRDATALTALNIEF
jgi:hypothetical protein